MQLHQDAQASRGLCHGSVEVHIPSCGAHWTVDGEIHVRLEATTDLTGAEARPHCFLTVPASRMLLGVKCPCQMSVTPCHQDAISHKACAQAIQARWQCCAGAAILLRICLTIKYGGTCEDIRSQACLRLCYLLSLMPKGHQQTDSCFRMQA